MFESICIRRQQPLYTPEPLDLSFLAEAMLFYQNVHLVADVDMLQQLLVECGLALVNEFIEEGFLKISYLATGTVIHEMSWTPPLTFGKFYQPEILQSAEDSWNLEKLVSDIFSGTAGAAKDERRFAELVPTLDVDKELDSAFADDLANASYIEHAVSQLLKMIAPTYPLPQDYYFRVSKEGHWSGYQIETNIDFQQANKSFNKTWHKANICQLLSPSSLLLSILEVRRDLFFAARAKTELATYPGNAAIIDVKLREILRAREKSEHEIEEFQRLLLVNSHEVGESIKLGYRSWHDLLALLKDKNTWNFKSWLQQRDANESLIREYIKALEKDNPWIASSPAKMLRFLITTAGGFVFTPLAAIGLSGADALLVDRLLGGWKPNQFVNGPLKAFARLD